MSEIQYNKTLSKQERLNSEKAISKLFLEGQSFVKYPLRVVYKEQSDECEVNRILISVPKKRFKRAVKRNRIKRLIREAYRQNKEIIISAIGECKKFDIAFVYVDSNLPNYNQIQQSVKISLTRIVSSAMSKKLE